MANVNTFTFDQVATILSSLQAQVQGVSTIANTTGEWVSVAQSTLRTGYDPVLNALSKLLDRTIFSVRPYEEKFRGLEADAIRWGNHTRKLQSIDNDLEDDDRFSLTDGQSLDHYEVKKPTVLQTNFYGHDVFQQHVTIFRDQLDTAFSGPEAFGQFLSMVMQNITDQLTQARETLARNTLNNLIQGTAANGPTESTVHLLTEFNVYTSASPAYTLADIQADPGLMEQFWSWVCNRIMEVSRFLTERTILYHTNPTVGGVAKPIRRHTPVSDQNFYMLSGYKYLVDTMVKSRLFNDEYLSKTNSAELVNFWQATDTPEEIDLLATAMNPLTGDYDIMASSSPISPVLGVIFDREAAGYVVKQNYTLPTPMNARGAYSNLYYHQDYQYWNDNTENCVVFLLD